MPLICFCSLWREIFFLWLSWASPSLASPLSPRTPLPHPFTTSPDFPLPASRRRVMYMNDKSGKISSLQNSDSLLILLPGKDPDRRHIVFHSSRDQPYLSPGGPDIPLLGHILPTPPASFAKDIFTTFLYQLFLTCSLKPVRGVCLHWGSPQKLELPLRQSIVTSPLDD